jgi:hypothetical protein
MHALPSLARSTELPKWRGQHAKTSELGPGRTTTRHCLT